jgi:formylglycine-generating enzyme required for sulfatase activity
MELPVPSRFASAAEMRAALGGEAPGMAPSKPYLTPKPQPAPKRQPTKAMPGARPAARRRRVPVWAWALGGAAGVVAAALCVGLALGALGGGLPALAPTGAPTETPTRRPTQPPTAIPMATPTELPTPTTAPTRAPRPTMPPAPSLGDTWTRPDDGMVMIYVPAGEFQMGATGYPDAEPVHLVVLDGFWIDRTEVTNAQYAQCVAAGRCEPPSKGKSSTRDSYYGVSAYDDYPVIYVSWYQARDYCVWARGRLSTEAEWEYAARGPEGRKYPWADGEPGCDVANYEGCVGDTTAAGSHPAGASWCGALDMAGNVWEWVGDWYGEYPSDRQENPAGPTSGEYRVMRGGGWDHSWGYVHTAYRRSNTPDSRFSSLGFRCVVSAGE